jgi:hypothetical protein
MQSNLIDRAIMPNDQTPPGAREEFERDGQRMSTFISRTARVFLSPLPDLAPLF